MPSQDNILNYSLKEVSDFLHSIKEKPFRARQIFGWIYRKQAETFDQMSNLSLCLRQSLADRFSIGELQITKKRQSRDGTRKYLFQCRDSQSIESALISAKDRRTICLSTQAGCKFSCQFCASGLSGFVRDLSCGEIIDQIRLVEKQISSHKITHIVFMGIGEPLDNLGAVLKSIEIINDPSSFHIGARRITVSTCGLIEGIRKLADFPKQVELSVSLHGANDRVRSALMPVNKRYPLKELMRACREYTSKTKRQITFEYLLIKDLTCTLKSVIELKSLLKGIIRQMNLIPYNAVSDLGHQPPTKLEMLVFQAELKKAGISSTVRLPRGKDIGAACGQLRLKK